MARTIWVMYENSPAVPWSKVRVGLNGRKNLKLNISCVSTNGARRPYPIDELRDRREGKGLL